MSRSFRKQPRRHLGDSDFKRITNKQVRRIPIAETDALENQGWKRVGSHQWDIFDFPYTEDKPWKL